MRSHISARWGVFRCMLGIAEALKNEISYFSMYFNAKLYVFECILGFAEALNKVVLILQHLFYYYIGCI